MRHSMTILITVALLVLCIPQETRSEGQVAPDDRSITVAVKQRIADDGGVETNRLQVETKKGTVHLNGIVRSESQAARAAQLAGQVSGVKDVVNDLSVER